MKKIMISVAVIFSAAFAAMVTAYILTGLGVLFTLAITFGTVSYHFDMRLIVGETVNAALHNKVNYKRGWFVVRASEQKFYDFLKVKKWKKHVHAYAPATFDVKLHSIEEIIMGTCQAEIVHEIIMLLSLLPIICFIWFGEVLVFTLTSVAAFLFDSVFVIVQRYNRPRLIKLMNAQLVKENKN